MSIINFGHVIKLNALARGNIRNNLFNRKRTLVFLSFFLLYQKDICCPVETTSIITLGMCKIKSALEIHVSCDLQVCFGRTLYWPWMCLAFFNMGMKDQIKPFGKIYRQNIHSQMCRITGNGGSYCFSPVAIFICDNILLCCYFLCTCVAASDSSYVLVWDLEKLDCKVRKTLFSTSVNLFSFFMTGFGLYWWQLFYFLFNC